jgi:hypothetical protein
MARKGSPGLGFAQSGGRDTTFGGGRGGTPLTKGVTKTPPEGTGMQGGFNQYTIRGEGGDNTPANTGRGKVGAPPPVHPGDSKQVTGIVKVKQLPPVLRGSTNALKGKYR